MVRIRLCAATIALIGVALSAEQSAAQFGSLFGPPPRPPSDVPTPGPPAQPLPSAPPQPIDPVTRAPAVIQSQPLSPPGSLSPQPQQASQPPAGTPPGQRQQPPGAAAALSPSDETITELPSQKIANPTAVFAGLDKITGRITSFDVAINETVQFGALRVTPRVCYTRPPTETPNTDAFIEVAEVTLQGEVKRIFDGWMFASSPGLHAVEHPIYDVWLTDCKGGASTMASTAPTTPATQRGSATANTSTPRQGTATPQRQPAKPAQTKRASPPIIPQ